MFSGRREACEEIVFIDAALAAIRGPIIWILGPQIGIEFDLDDDLPGFFCDRQEFENAVFNLVINARDAMPDGGCLRIECRCENANGDYGIESPARQTLVLRVIDNGEGMSQMTARSAFTAFYTTKPSERGNGLGLAMVSDFMRRAGGSADIESVIGAGTTVVLRFPVVL